MTRSNALVRSVETAVMTAVMAAIRLGRRGRPPAPEPAYRGSAVGQRVLVCKWCCLGDAILSLYAIRAFKKAHPGIAVDVLVSSRIAEVYRRAPEIADVYVVPVTGRRLVLELLSPNLWRRFASQLIRLRGNGYSQFIDLELYRGTGPILKRLIGIPFSRGFAVEGALPKLHDFEVAQPRHAPEWQGFYGVMGLPLPSTAPEPLWTAEPSVRKARRVSGGARIGVVPGASFNWPQKKWPWEHFAETIALLSREGHEFVLFGSPEEKEENARILAMAGGKVADTTGSLDYAGLREEVTACDLLVGNDTGTMHLAAACGVPTVTLFGPTDPGKWNPLTSTPVFLESVPCRPCYYLGSMPPCDHLSCLRKMEPALVASKIREALAARGKKTPPPEE